MIIDYDKNPNISPEQRLQSLIDSIRRAFEELSGDINAIEKKIESVEKEIEEIREGD